MLPKEIQILIAQIPPETQPLVKAIVAFYEHQVSDLKARVKELEDQKAKNSSNSSKPPSTDPPKKKPKSTRTSTTRKPGGQKGHKGTTLQLVDNPDDTIPHKVNECSCCTKDLSNQEALLIARRQVHDIPLPKVKIIEHQSEVKPCSCGHINTAFPAGVTHYVQYGPVLKSMATYLQDYQMLPYKRTKELFKDFFSISISQGTLYNIGKTAYKKLESFKDRLKELLTYCLVVGFDETGFRVLATRLWLHSYSTEKHAYFEVHAKRGREAMDEIGILPDFKGIAVHDFWKSYYTYCCEHALCNAHLLRDLIFIKERFEQPWAEELIQLLLKMKAAKEKAMEKDKPAFSQSTIKRYQDQYETIVQKGLEENPFKPPEKKSRGRYAKPPPRNLLERLDKHQGDVLRFFLDFKVPFDNNFSERDLRMMKVKQKISGGFRSLKGAKYFARIRSYILTARKQNVNPLEALTNLFMDNTVGEWLTRDLELFYAE